LALSAAAARRQSQIQAGRNRSGRSCAHGFGLGTKGVACRADRDLIAAVREAAEEAERSESAAGAVEVKFMADENPAAEAHPHHGSPERRDSKNGGHDQGQDDQDEVPSASSSDSSEEEAAAGGPDSPSSRRRTRRTRRTKQNSAEFAAMTKPPPLGYRLNSGLTENPRAEEEDCDHSDSDDDEEEAEEEEEKGSDKEGREEEEKRAESSPRPSPLRPCSTNTNPNGSPSTPTADEAAACSPTTSSPVRIMPTAPPSILRNRLSKSPPTDLDLVGRVYTADTVDTMESTEDVASPTSASSPTNAAANAAATNRQPAWLEALERDRELKRSAQDTGRAAQKLRADALRHSDAARRRAGMGLFAPSWGGDGNNNGSSPARSYDRRNLPTTY
jgi:hypothetical protein